MKHTAIDTVFLIFVLSVLLVAGVDLWRAVLTVLIFGVVLALSTAKRHTNN